MKNDGMVYRDCLVCGGNKHHVWAEDETHTAVQCDECSFVWMNPCPNEDMLAEYYATYSETHHGLKEKAEKRKYQYIMDRDYILRFLDVSGKKQFSMLDVGCSIGAFLDTFDDRFDKYGTEIDSGAVKIAKEKFGDRIFHGDVGDFEFSGKFDLITMRGVIEHMIDPGYSVRKVEDLLKDDGLFYITATPNVDSFCAHVYREKWNLFFPDSHLSHFSDKTITKYLKKFGLEVIAKDFPYVDTPYENKDLDYKAMIKACIDKHHNGFGLNTSRAFWGNMMSIVAKKGR